MRGRRARTGREAAILRPALAARARDAANENRRLDRTRRPAPADTPVAMREQLPAAGILPAHHEFPRRGRPQWDRSKAEIQSGWETGRLRSPTKAAPFSQH